MRDLPQGWLSPADVKELRRLAAGKVVLELGAYKGRSTVVLSEVAAHVISVDRHKGVVGVPEDTLPEYLEAVRPLPNVSIVVADFRQFIRYIKRVDMVFIDGDHDYDSVIADIVGTWHSDATLFAFHDWDFEEVRQAAEYLFLRKPDRVGGSVASFTRR